MDHGGNIQYFESVSSFLTTITYWGTASEFNPGVRIKEGLGIRFAGSVEPFAGITCRHGRFLSPGVALGQ